MNHRLAPPPALRSAALTLILAAAALLLLACATSPATTQGARADALDLPGGHTAVAGITTAGQISPGQMEAAQRAGYRTIINLRADGEEGTWDEAPKAAELGLRYVHLPVAGAAGLTEANARALSEALASSQQPVVLHCSSGNRAGALLALKAHLVDGMSAEDALQLGRDAGVTKLEPALRQALGLGDEGPLK